MRHRNHRHTLGLTKEHRSAVMANLSVALIEHGRIQTTVTKAKALRPYVEKLVTLAKKAQKATPERSVALRRVARARLRDETAVYRLFNERVGEFMDRPGGYTRIYKIGPRLGDAAEMALITFIDADDEGYGKSKRKSGAKKAAKKASTKKAAAKKTAAADDADAEEATEAKAEASGDEAKARD